MTLTQISERFVSTVCDPRLVLGTPQRSAGTGYDGQSANATVIPSVSPSHSHPFNGADSDILALVKAIQSRDPDLGRHCERIALMSTTMGLLLGLSDQDIRTLRRSAYIHDLGKIALPDKVLFKASPLNASEWELMKTHPAVGEQICKTAMGQSALLPLIRHHHEHWDGSGYPDKLKGEEIPYLARILQMADVYDALTSKRPYKQRFTPAEAIAVLGQETRRGWRDPNLMPIVEASLPLLESASFWRSGTNRDSGFSLPLCA